MNAQLTAHLDAYRDGTISESDARWLSEAIRSGSPEGRWFMHHLASEGLISQALEPVDAAAIVRAVTERRRADDHRMPVVDAWRSRQRRRLLPLRFPRLSVGLAAAAAGILVLLGVGWATREYLRPPTVGDLAGRYVRAGDRIQAETPDTTIRFHDGSVAVLDQGTILQIERSTGSLPSLTFHMSQGRVDISAAHQMPGASLQVVTPHARATVLGTRFTVINDQEETRLLVLDGRVRFSDLADTRAVEVGAGEGSVASVEAPPTHARPAVPLAVNRRPGGSLLRNGRPWLPIGIRTVHSGAELIDLVRAGSDLLILDQVEPGTVERMAEEGAAVVAGNDPRGWPGHKLYPAGWIGASARRESGFVFTALVDHGDPLALPDGADALLITSSSDAQGQDALERWASNMRRLGSRIRNTAATFLPCFSAGPALSDSTLHARAWLALIHGAAGIVIDDQGESRPAWHRSLARLADAWQTAAPIISDGRGRLLSDGTGGLHAAQWQYGDDLLLAAVNTSSASACDLALPIPAGEIIQTLAGSSDGVQLSAGRLSGTLPAGQVLVLRLRTR